MEAIERILRTEEVRIAGGNDRSVILAPTAGSRFVSQLGKLNRAADACKAAGLRLLPQMGCMIRVEI